MTCLNVLQSWIEKNHGFAYYLNYRFLEAFNDCEIRYKEEAEHIIVLYDNYAILDLVIQNRSIVLMHERINKGEAIQRKLTNEYIRFFDLNEKPFKITQYNMFAFLQYIEGVKKKIDAGFEKYSKLLEKNIKTASLGQLQIGISNVFSLEDLEKLIDAYNRLYSIIYYACEFGIDEINDNNIESVEREYNMVLESIHIGSDGWLATVGAGLVVEIVKAFISAVYEGNKGEAERHKNELTKKAQLEDDLETRQYIFNLINLLDSYLQRRENGCHPGVLSYMDYEIDKIVKTIEELQGTTHIDVLC